MNLKDRADEALKAITDTSEKLDNLHEKPAPIVKFIRASDITPKPISWLWSPFLPQGKLVMFAGPSGAGKTTLAIRMAATITSGSMWPSGTTAQKGRVLIWSGEDDLDDTLVPRLLACGADLGMVDFVKSTDTGDGLRDFTPSTDMACVEEAIKNEPPALFIIDPIVSAIRGDSHKNAEVRQSLEPLRNLAERHRTTVLGISHFSKGTKGADPVERVTGSLAFAAAPRVVLAAAKLPEDDERGSRLFCIAKSNLGLDVGGFAYDIEPTYVGDGIKTTHAVWGQALEGTARDLLAQAETTDSSEMKTALDDAMDFLRSELEGGRQRPPDVMKKAKAEGISERTLQRAKSALRVETHRSGYGGGCHWVLPDHTSHPRQAAKAGNNGENGNAGEYGESATSERIEPKVEL